LRFEPGSEDWDGEGEGKRREPFCEVLLVNLNKLTRRAIGDALRSCGWELGEGWEAVSDCGEVLGELATVEALVGYGVYAPMGSESSPYPMRCRARARRLADELMGDEGLMRKALRRKVNALGSSAGDFGKGDCLAGLRRTAKKVLMGEPCEVPPESEVTLKMFASCGGRTLGGEVEVELALAGSMSMLENRRRNGKD
jgi:hypothetical protein